MTTPTVMRPEMSRALALLVTNHTIQQTAELTDWPIGSIRALVAGQRGWLLVGDRVACPGNPGGKITVPDGVTADDLQWAQQQKGKAPSPAITQRPAAFTPPTRPPATVGPETPRAAQPGTVDQLLVRAAGVDDKRVQAALRATLTTIGVLRERLTGVEQRAAEEAAKESERAAARQEIAELEAALAAARSRAKQLGVKTGKTTPPAPAAPSPASDPGRDPDKWEPGREPTAVAARRYSPGVDYQPAEVRTWAKSEGYTFPRQGRFLSGPLVQAWIDAQGGEA